MAGRLDGWTAGRLEGLEGLEGWTAEGLVPRRTLRSPEPRGRAAASNAPVRAGDPGLEGWNGGWAAGSARAGGLEGLPAGSRAQVVQPFVEKARSCGSNGWKKADRGPADSARRRRFRGRAGRLDQTSRLNPPLVRSPVTSLGLDRGIGTKIGARNLLSARRGRRTSSAGGRGAG